MSDKTFIPADEIDSAPASQIGATLEALVATIAARRSAGEESYTYQLLTRNIDTVLKKLMEEACEVTLAAKDADYAVYFAGEAKDIAGGTTTEKHLSSTANDQLNHLRYEAADVVYHLLVLLARFGISLDELAAELNMRMSESERPCGACRLLDADINRGK